jgi:3-methyladenine DNA glycosylase AlkD
MQNEIIKKLLKYADTKYKKFHSSLCPGTNNILGVRIPVIRNIAKEIYKTNSLEKYLLIKPKYNEEIMIQAMLIGFIKDDLQKVLYRACEFIPKINNWGVCDIFCSGLKITKKHHDIVWDFIQKYSKSKKEFELRFMIVMMLCYFLNDNYIHKVLEKIDKIKHNGYYVKMALAWAISTAYTKYPIITMKYLKNNNLDIFTFNKSLQKITESYRVSKKDKIIIKGMKKC